MARAKPAKVTRILHSQGLNKAKSERREHIAERADAWQGCSGLSTAPQTALDIRDAWMPPGTIGTVCRPCRGAPHGRTPRATSTPTGKWPGSPLCQSSVLPTHGPVVGPRRVSCNLQGSG